MSSLVSQQVVQESLSWQLLSLHCCVVCGTVLYTPVQEVSERNHGVALLSCNINSYKTPLMRINIHIKYGSIQLENSSEIHVTYGSILFRWQSDIEV